MYAGRTLVLQVAQINTAVIIAHYTENRFGEGHKKYKATGNMLEKGTSTEDTYSNEVQALQAINNTLLLAAFEGLE